MTPESMAAEQQIEYLATKVMGWKKTEEFNGAFHYYVGGNLHIVGPGWNPLISWDFWREVEVEAVRNYTLWHNFMHKLGINTTGTNVPSDCTKMYSRSILSVRVSALITAHKELYPST